MARRRSRTVLVAVLAVAGIVVSGTVAADARRAASVVLTTLTPKIDLGAQPTFRYSTSGVPSDGIVRLQRLVSGTWTTVAERLPGTDKQVKAPAPTSIGKYSYRMRAFDHQGAFLAQTAHNHNVYVFRNIKIETLCPHTVGNRSCAGHRVTVNGNKVDMHMALGATVFPSYFSSAYFPRTSCRSAALRFATKTAHAKSYVKFVQGTTSKGASAPVNQLGHFNPTGLTGARLYFDASVQSTADGTGVFLDGTMNCWTATGTY